MEIRKLPSERAPKFPNQTAETLSRDSRHLLAAILNSIKTRYGILALLGIKRDAFACNFLIAPFVSFRVSACRLTNRRMILNLARAQNSSAPSVCAEPRSVCVCVYLGNKAPRTRPFIILPRTEIKPQIDMGARLLLLLEFTFSAESEGRERERNARASRPQWDREINWNNSNNLLNYHRVLPFLESK
jgi:hypothetical protein